ncbi:hypothetical protein J6590_037583 [Homalodisca vitripennis]|nr:hypothetical protein J6590_037583 [Homalodisca vitripennis]
MVREFLPTMRERNSGHIVAVASVGGMVAFANGSAYVASKFGVRGFMEAVRAELESKANNNVKTTTVCPYFVNTSALYVDHWDLRIPAISIEEAVEATIAAIKREELIVVMTTGPAQKTLACLFKTQITRWLPAAQCFALLALLEKKLTRAGKVQAQINSPRFIEHKTQKELTQVSLQAKDKRRAFITDKIRRVYTRSSTWTTALRTNDKKKRLNALSVRLLPQYIVDQVSKIFYVRIIPPTQHEKDVSPTAAIVKDLIDQDVI